jgi:hypothetical protein
MTNLKEDKDIYQVFIYCGGKCGSSTLFRTFKNLNYKCLHVHRNYYYCLDLDNDISLFDTIEKSRKHFDKIYIIDSYRTPIERKISSFFQNIHKHTDIKDFNNIHVNEVIEIFNKKNYIYYLEDYHPFDEILDYLNINNNIPFDFSNKYTIMHHENIVLIKLLFKDINEWGNILGNIFNTEIKMISDNESKNKTYFTLYKKFLENYKPPKKYINCFLKHDKKFKTYNTHDEQNDYIQYWLNK